MQGKVGLIVQYKDAVFGAEWQDYKENGKVKAFYYQPPTSDGALWSLDLKDPIRISSLRLKMIGALDGSMYGSIQGRKEDDRSVSGVGNCYGRMQTASLKLTVQSIRGGASQFQWGSIQDTILQHLPGSCSSARCPDTATCADLFKDAKIHRHFRTWAKMSLANGRYSQDPPPGTAPRALSSNGSSYNVTAAIKQLKVLGEGTVRKFVLCIQQTSPVKHKKVCCVDKVHDWSKNMKLALGLPCAIGVQGKNDGVDCSEADSFDWDGYNITKEKKLQGMGLGDRERYSQAMARITNF